MSENVLTAAQTKHIAAINVIKDALTGGKPTADETAVALEFITGVSAVLAQDPMANFRIANAADCLRLTNGYTTASP